MNLRGARWTAWVRGNTRLVFFAPNFGNLKRGIAGLDFRGHGLGGECCIAGSKLGDFGGLSVGEIVFFVGILEEVK